MHSVRIEAKFGHAHVALYPLDTLPTCSRHTPHLFSALSPLLFSSHLYAPLLAGALPGFLTPMPTAPWAYRNPRALAGAGKNSTTFRCCPKSSHFSSWPKKAHTFRVDPKISHLPTRAQNLTISDCPQMSPIWPPHPMPLLMCVILVTTLTLSLSLSQLSPREPSVNEF